MTKKPTRSDLNPEKINTKKSEKEFLTESLGKRQDLDEWLEDRLPIKNATAFKNECLQTDHNIFSTYDDLGHKQGVFFEAIQNAFYGDTEILSLFLTDSRWKCVLTEQKEKVIAWFLENPQSKTDARLIKYERMKNIAVTASWLIKTRGISESKAINEACHEQVKYSKADNDLLIKHEESLRRQFYRALRDDRIIKNLFKNNSQRK